METSISDAALCSTYPWQQCQPTVWHQQLLPISSSVATVLINKFYCLSKAFVYCSSGVRATEYHVLRQSWLIMAKSPSKSYIVQNLYYRYSCMKFALAIFYIPATTSSPPKMCTFTDYSVECRLSRAHFAGGCRVHKTAKSELGLSWGLSCLQTLRSKPKGSGHLLETQIFNLALCPGNQLGVSFFCYPGSFHSLT